MKKCGAVLKKMRVVLIILLSSPSTYSVCLKIQIDEAAFKVDEKSTIHASGFFKDTFENISYQTIPEKILNDIRFWLIPPGVLKDYIDSHNIRFKEIPQKLLNEYSPYLVVEYTSDKSTDIIAQTRLSQSGVTEKCYMAKHTILSENPLKEKLRKMVRGAKKFNELKISLEMYPLRAINSVYYSVGKKKISCGEHQDIQTDKINITIGRVEDPYSNNFEVFTCKSSPIVIKDTRKK